MSPRFLRSEAVLLLALFCTTGCGRSALWPRTQEVELAACWPDGASCDGGSCVQGICVATGLAAGGTHSCALRDADLWCWGINRAGQVGVGDVLEQSQPVTIGAPRSWSWISAGLNHTCGVHDDGDLACWGSNEGFGQLGTGDQDFRTSPTSVVETGPWRRVSAGQFHTCAIKTEGSLWCFGPNAEGNLGIPFSANALTPTRVGPRGDWAGVSASWGFHSCGITQDSGLRCWGANTSGQLALDPTTISRTDRPTVVAGSWRAVSGGFEFTCAIDTEARLWCWGGNSVGQLGLGNNNAGTFVPQRVGGGSNWRTVVAGSDHVCAINQLDELHCWGSNLSGQLGVGDSERRSSPTTVPGRWLQVSVGLEHSCAVAGDFSVWCWGKGENLQLGLGGLSSTTEPTRVSFL